MYLTMISVTLADLKITIMHYFWDHIKHSRTPEPSRGHALAVHVLVGVFETTLVLPG